MTSKRQRYRTLDVTALMELLGVDEYEKLVTQRSEWVEQALAAGMGEEGKDPRWTAGIAVGSYEFVENVQLGLGYSVSGRSIVESGGSCVLREEETGYDAF